MSSVRGSVRELLADANGEKKRNFVETVELQIGLKNYDPQRDKRFSGTVKCVPPFAFVLLPQYSFRNHAQTPSRPPPAHVHLHSRGCRRHRPRQADQPDATPSTSLPSTSHPLTPDYVHAVILLIPLLKKSMRRQVAPHQADGRQARPSLLDTSCFMSDKQLAFSIA